MVYFAISDYTFNTASLVYYQAGYMNFSFTDDTVRTEQNGALYNDVTDPPFPPLFTAAEQ